MNQGLKRISLMKKNGGKKSRDTIPLTLLYRSRLNESNFELKITVLVKTLFILTISSKILV